MRMVLGSLRMVMHLIRDRKGRREKLLLLLESALLGYPFLTGLFVNDNCYGVETEEWKIMDEFFRRASKDYSEVVKALNKVFEAAEASGNKEGIENAVRSAKKEFYRKLGSRSYHTGLPV